MRRKHKDTRVELVQELQRIMPLMENAVHVPQLKFMIAEAKAGEYHDFKNERYACGKMASNGYLVHIGTPSALALAERIREGEFDEPPDEADKAELSALLVEGK